STNIALFPKYFSAGQMFADCCRAFLAVSPRVKTFGETLFPYDLRRFLIESDALKHRVPQVSARSPFGEPDLTNHSRIQPNALSHLARSEPLAPPSAAGLWDIHKRTFLPDETLKLLEKATQHHALEATADLRGKQQL